MPSTRTETRTAAASRFEWRRHARAINAGRGQAAAAAAAAFALGSTAMLELSRVPPSADFILPRHPGFAFFELFMRARAHRAAVVWPSSALVALSLAGAGWAGRKRPWALAAALSALWIFLGRWLDLCRAGESVSLAEPAAALVASGLLAFLAFMAPRSKAWAAAFAAAAVLPLFLSPAPLDRPEAARMEALADLAGAPDTQLSRAKLDGLADETRWRVGPHGAAMLARAYAHFGEKEKAAFWRARSGIPEGLLMEPLPALSGGGTPAPRTPGAVRER